MAVKNRIDSEIPAGYTYLAQFVDHDISLDSQSNKLPWIPINVEQCFNERIPIFDLETLYGVNAEDDSVYLEKNSAFLKLGKTTVPSGSFLKKSLLLDLPRNENKKALILDSRNDENLLVAQTHVAFATFHNTIVYTLQNKGITDTTQLYKTAREQTIRHYQYLVITDLLDKILDKKVLERVKKEGNIFYNPDKDDTFIPLEYSAAAFRFGHSMVRNSYNLNSIKVQTLIDLRLFTGESEDKKKKLGKQATLPSDWLINWKLFFDLDAGSAKPANFNFAHPIEPKLSSLLGDLIGFSDSNFRRVSSLAAFDLYRGQLFNLPFGKRLADELPPASLDADKINRYLSENYEGVNLIKAFGDKVPLWFYLLAESDGNRMGKIGSRIIAEVFIELIKRSPFSILTDETPAKFNFPANGEDFYGTADKVFGMAQMLRFISDNPIIINGEAVNENFLDPVGSLS
ncbi:MAG TPA: peroxidase family protein [Pyrinomonadaceae bacterium]|nr:peroxidase family protein [Pyrinomonadaceae bacterium]